MAQNKAQAETIDPAVAAKLEEDVAYLAKRHRVSAAIVREIIRRTGATEKSAIEREIEKGKARR
ncbi:hypothetical protein [Plastoroseomonas hellenica]|uniref:DUF3606 domain-containing protein n=1 Tax=Plastoroseomonas hellenica TaxID=2687306 RepID=A0ABS5F0J1_9PROT|nr:hypothetical protein [Plastoroseomonas hellenica]MBR0645637.1 hypothetical protein [Plastoroseomonas hellenica]MBR0666073.1 hypothetical protein [Plastoroseomonas hellenica]